LLITKTVIQKWNGANKKFYEPKGYIWTKPGDEFNVKVEDLSENNSQAKLTMECNNPNCETTKEISNRSYVDRLRSYKPYICTKCLQNGFRVEDFMPKSSSNAICKEDNCNNKVCKDDLCEKHWFQIENINKIIKPLDHPCEMCGSEHGVEYNSKVTMYLCRKHLLQYGRHGVFYNRTIYDDNEIILHEDYADILLYDVGGNVLSKAQIDLDDIDKVKRYKWHLGDTGYVLACVDGFNIRLHKLVLNQYEDYKGHDYDNMTDHMDRNRLNCRKENLRIVNDSGNKQNRDLMINNKTGRTGLQYIAEQKNRHWCVAMAVNYKKQIEKSYQTREEAEYVLDIYELLYKPLTPNYDALKNKYSDILDILLEVKYKGKEELNIIIDTYKQKYMIKNIAI